MSIRSLSAALATAALLATSPVNGHGQSDAHSVHLPDHADESDFEAAQRGFIGTFTDGRVTDENGRVVYDFNAYDFMQGPAPETANPLLWRQGQLNAIHGLFEVTDGIYQVRGYDLSNITFIRGETGWIVVDPLITKEVAAKALELVERELGKRPIVAVFYTHPHIDHYGGVRGIISDEDVANGTMVVAPEGFVREAVSENILAGNAMARRATYMFGSLLPRSPEGQIGVGLGPGISTGSAGMIPPTHTIDHTGQKMTIDGIDFEFLLSFDAEAPSEFMFYMPQFRAFGQAEMINKTLHNLYTLRGAKVRDGLGWSKYIDEVIYTYGDRTDVSFGSHHWPTWGNEEILGFWSSQRDLYRYLHDQTLRLANLGYTINEIPELITLPEGIATRFANRGYYGSVSHNVRGQYQLYLGFFDGNPANLDPVPPEEAGRKFVEYAGGSEALIAKAREDFANGEMRFAATALNHLVFAQPDNEEAAELLAQIYTQMGYRAESGPWRNFYLTGAMELREGVADLPATTTASADTIRSLPLDLFFELLGVRLNGPEASKQDRTFNFNVSDTDQHALLILSNGALHYRMGHEDTQAPTFHITSDALVALNTKEKTLPELVATGEAGVEGDAQTVFGFFQLVEEPEFWFEIVRP